MSILNFLKKIKLPSFEDEFIVDPMDQASPKDERRNQVFVTMHREKGPTDRDSSGREDWLEGLVQQNWDLHTDPSDAASLVADVADNP